VAAMEVTVIAVGHWEAVSMAGAMAAMAEAGVATLAAVMMAEAAEEAWVRGGDSVEGVSRGAAQAEAWGKERSRPPIPGGDRWHRNAKSRARRPERRRRARFVRSTGCR